MKEPCPPFIVFDEAGDVKVYAEFDQMHGQLEGIDVEDGVFEIFDSRGSELRIATEDVKRGKFSVDVGRLTHIDVVRSTSVTHDRLVELTRRYLLRIGVTMKHDSSLEEMISRLPYRGGPGR